MIFKRLKDIEDKILATPKFIEKMEEIFSTGSFDKLTSEDVDKLIVSMPDKYEILKNELVKQMIENL